MIPMRAISDVLAHLFHPRLSNNHRPRIIHPEGFLLLFLIAAVLSISIRVILPGFSQKGGVLGYSSSITQQKVVEKTNEERRKMGLSDLTFNEVLSQAAEDKARDMFQAQYWSHYSPNGKSPWDFMKEEKYVYSVAGENLARDFLETDDMMRAWMNSPTHRENIINPRYHDIGIAVVNGQLNGVETTLVVQMFGTQLNGSVASAQLSQAGERIEIEEVPIPRQGGILDDTFVPDTEAVQADSTKPILAISMQSLSLNPESPLLSPLRVLKAVFLAIIILVLSVLVYDFVIAENRQTVRFVGKNFGHIALFLAIFFLVLLFKGGVVL
jgi:hypothetical protein